MKDAAFQSASLGREATCRILLPADYEISGVRYPVLYLLHGLYGDRTNLSMLTKLSEHARSYKLIIVMPDAGNSWYANSFSEPHDRYDDFILRELISWVDATYRTKPQREFRAIAGLSMGGYGALKFSLKRPDLFAFTGSMTGALHAPLGLGEEVAEFREDLLKAFGPPGNPLRAQNDVFALADAADPARLPYIYVDCGIQDGFLSINRQFAALLEQRKIRYEYHELPGGHEWEYWDSRLPSVLRALARHVSL
jgi:S-formylglutathione hydrolase FrmB